MTINSIPKTLLVKVHGSDDNVSPYLVYCVVNFIYCGVILVFVCVIIVLLLVALWRLSSQ